MPTGVSLTFQADDVLVSSIPTVLMDREVTEVTRGRPTVAVGIVRVRQLQGMVYAILIYHCYHVYVIIIFTLCLSHPVIE